MIYYFSGTGNSKYVAKQLKNGISESVFSLNDAIKTHNYDASTNDKRAIFVTPTYAWRMPRICSDYILNANFGDVKEAYFILTCGDNTCNAYKYCKKICKIKGWDFFGFSEIIMPNNYCIMFDAATSEEAREVIKNSEESISKVISLINCNKKFVIKKDNLLDPIMSGVVNSAFYPFCVKPNFHVTDDCIGCGLCEKLCPLNNINIVDGKPNWSKNCTHCSACINACPKQAIEFGDKTQGKIRYYLNVDL